MRREKGIAGQQTGGHAEDYGAQPNGHAAADHVETAGAASWDAGRQDHLFVNTGYIGTDRLMAVMMDWFKANYPKTNIVNRRNATVQTGSPEQSFVGGDC